METKEKKPRVLMGRVVSNKMKDTVVVKIDRSLRHPLYGKTLHESKKVHAHDAGNQCKEGDLVKVGEIKPMSKTKTWSLVEIVERAK